MSEQENRSILTISLMASFADGAKDERERDEIRRIAEGLGGDGLDVARLYQDVLLERVGLDDAVAGLASAQTRQLAYEMAVCVCDADGVQSEAERAFLADLAGRLGLDPASSRDYSERAEAIASAPLGATGGAAAVATPAAPPASTAERPSSMSDAEMDKAILNASILNGALELLPESLATMAIIPLQMKLVYRIGQSYGYELDRGHVKDFLATAGVGLTSQYIEQAGRKLLGGLIGAIGGGLLGGLGRQAVSSGMSFASTYALGHVAKRYYAGGRVLSTQMLREAFQQMLGEAKDLQANYLPQMQEQARSLNPAKIVQMVRGG
ncbi:YcjF family protein [Dokdonella ginsengisoli]|uniref:YcjF family protein n=1 Tax=Dokdonella ginsengisoli TaxID=363846 RepID=A0ABV9R0W5_9GAMM